MYAGMAGHCAAVEMLLNCGADVNAVNVLEDSPLTLAGCEGSARVLQLLTAAGAAVNHSNRNGWTALHRVALHGHSRHAISALLKAGARPELRDKTGRSAIELCCGNSPGRSALLGANLKMAQAPLRRSRDSQNLHQQLERSHASSYPVHAATDELDHQWSRDHSLGSGLQSPSPTAWRQYASSGSVSPSQRNASLAATTIDHTRGYSPGVPSWLRQSNDPAELTQAQLPQLAGTGSSHRLRAETRSSRVTGVSKGSPMGSPITTVNVVTVRLR
jgi:hypothetical protein